LLVRDKVAASPNGLRLKPIVKRGRDDVVVAIPDGLRDWKPDAAHNKCGGLLNVNGVLFNGVLFDKPAVI
jgi:hypothetical protein